MRFTFDTNVLVYAVDRDAGPRHEAAIGILRRSRGRDCVLTVQALAELFRTLTGRKLGVPAERATEMVRGFQHAFPIVAADEAALVDAMDAVNHHGWSFWDAMMWATAKRQGCRVLVSEDGQSGRTLGGVTIVDPFSTDGAGLLEPLFKAGP